MFFKGDQLKIKLANLKFSKNWRWTLVFSIRRGFSNRTRGLAGSSILRAGYATLLLAEHNNKSLNKVGMHLNMFEQSMFKQDAVDIFGCQDGRAVDCVDMI